MLIELKCVNDGALTCCVGMWVWQTGWGMCWGGSVSVSFNDMSLCIVMAHDSWIFPNFSWQWHAMVCCMLISQPPPRSRYWARPALSSISLFSIPPRSSTSYCNNRRPGELDQSQHYAKNKAKYSGPVISIWLIQLDIIILCPEPHYPVPGSLRINIPPEPQWPI